MRASLLFVSFGLASLYACASSSSDAGTGTPGVPDGGATRDARAPIGDANVQPDSAAPDAALNAGGSLTVWAHQGTLARADWPVIAHGADGEVLRQGKTDATGRATLDATGVSMVTLVGDSDNFTFMDIRSADVLELSVPLPESGTSLGTLKISLPALPAGTSYVGLISACGSLSDTTSRPDWSLIVNSACVGRSGKVSAFALLQDGGYAISHLGVANAATPPVGNGEASTSVGSFAAPSFFEFSGPLGLVNLYGGVVVDGLRIDMAGWQRGFTRGGRWPSLQGVTQYIDFAFSQRDPAHENTSSIYFTRRLSAGNAGLDMGSAPVPGPMVVEATADNADAQRPTLRWTVEGDASTRQGTLVRTRFGTGRTWAFSLPAAARELRVPALPSDQAAVAPTGGVAGPYVILAESTRFANAAQFRQRGMYLALSNTLREDGPETTQGSLYFPSFR